MQNQEIVLLTGGAHPALAAAIARQLQMELTDSGCRSFPNGETFAEIAANIRGRDVFIVQPTCAPTNQTLMELLVLVDAARRASAGRITAMIPYYGYARQDRKADPRTPITAKLVANLLVAAGVNRVVAAHLHAAQIQGFFDIPVDHLETFPVLVPAVLAAGYENLVVAAPDIGAIKNAHVWGKHLGVPVVVVAKNRISDEDVEVASVIGDVSGRTVLLVDDLTETFGTLDAAARELLRLGAVHVAAAVSHAPLLPKGLTRLADSPIEQLFATNSVPVPEHPKIKICDFSGLLSGAVWRIHENQSVTSLFEVRA